VSQFRRHSEGIGNGSDPIPEPWDAAYRLAVQTAARIYDPDVAWLAADQDRLEKLAQEFSLEIGRCYYHARGVRDWPIGVDLQQAQAAVDLLKQSLGESRFRRMLEIWQSWLIEGIDY